MGQGVARRSGRKTLGRVPPQDFILCFLSGSSRCPGFNDIAMVGQAIQQGGGHFGIAEHL